jgi:hypothetical protein
VTGGKSVAVDCSLSQLGMLLICDWGFDLLMTQKYLLDAWDASDYPTRLNKKFKVNHTKITEIDIMRRMWWPLPVISE